MSEDKQWEVGYKVSSRSVFCAAGIPSRYSMSPWQWHHESNTFNL